MRAHASYSLYKFMCEIFDIDLKRDIDEYAHTKEFVLEIRPTEALIHVRYAYKDGDNKDRIATYNITDDYKNDKLKAAALPIKILTRITHIITPTEKDIQ